MQVKIGKYKPSFDPFTFAEILCFWVKDVKDESGLSDKPDWVYNFGNWLAYGSFDPDANPKNPTWFFKFTKWIDSKKKRKIYVKIDKWDSWSADVTLAYIILPLLKEVKLKKNGSPIVDDEDVPDSLKSTSAKPLSHEETMRGYIDEYFHLRWDYVIDEIIFAFENIVDDSWEDKFYDFEENDENGLPKIVNFDHENFLIYQDRINNGLRLFGKYYKCLWT
jgi:hypothetical protein